jgi:HAD superfamily hydrolase (TIGR01484 family)
MKSFHAKDLIVFDLDGTLAPSKSVMDREMTSLFERLLAAKKVAVIGGGKYALFKMQLLAALRNSPKDLLKNLFLFPTTSNAFYRYDHGWKNVYTLELPKRQRTKIKRAFRDVFKEVGYQHPKKVYGPVIEDRGTQVTFSALGQEVVAALGKKGIKMKEEWKEKNTPLKMKMAKLLAKRLPDLEVHAAGFTSIDVTRKGIDKAYGVRQIEKKLHVPIKKMVFIGDALFPGGNDYAARKSGIDCIPVRDPEDTKKIIKNILKEA